jgi:hypothetical protein
VCILSASLSIQQWLPTRLTTKAFHRSPTCGCHSLTLTSCLRLQVFPSDTVTCFTVARRGGGAASSSWLETGVKSFFTTSHTFHGHMCHGRADGGWGSVTYNYGHTEGGWGWIRRGSLTHTLSAPGNYRAPANYYLPHVPAVRR